MGSNDAARGNEIAQASLNESKKQYSETKAKENASKASAKANATSVRKSGNESYSNNFTTSTDFTTDSSSANSYSLLTAGGTQSVIGSLLGVSEGLTNKLGG